MPRVADDDDLAVGLDGDGRRAASPRERHPAAAAEVRVERARRAQPRHHGAGGGRPSGDHDPPVGLAGQCPAEVVAAEVDRGDARGGEGRVQRTVGLEPRDLDVPALGAREAADQELAVGGHHHGRGAADRSPADHLPAVAVEGGVQRAVGLQPHHGDLQARVSGEDDLPVGLQRRSVDGLVVGAEVDDALAARAEGGVERAVGGPQAHDAEGARRAATPGGDDAPVGLHEHDARLVGAAEVDRLLPAAAEARIEVTRMCHGPTVPARATTRRRPACQPECARTARSRPGSACARSRARHRGRSSRTRSDRCRGCRRRR